MSVNFYNCTHAFHSEKTLPELRAALTKATGLTWGTVQKAFDERPGINAFSSTMGTLRIYSDDNRFAVNISITRPTMDRSTWNGHVNLFLATLARQSAPPLQDR